MNIKKLFNNKTAKGLVSLATIIILLSSILATSLFYQNNITGYVVSEVLIDSEPTTISIKEVNNINELSQLSEGWYEIRNGYVYYLDSFTSYVPLYFKVKNPEQQNGLLAVGADGNIEFIIKEKQLVETQLKEENQQQTQNQITGKVTGLERVSGFK